MNALKRRFDKLEERLKTDKKYEGCELEIVVGTDGEPTKYYCLHPDGHSERITDNRIISELEAINDGSIAVEIVD
jgi:hypothetical protein